MTDAAEIDALEQGSPDNVFTNLLDDRIKDLHAQLEALTRLANLAEHMSAIRERLKQVPGLKTRLSLNQVALKFTLEIWLEDVSAGKHLTLPPDVSPDPAPPELRADAEGAVLDPDAVADGGVQAEGGDGVAAAASPLPEGKPDIAPKPADAAPKSKKGAAPFWDDARCKTLIRMKMDGHTAKDIAKKVGTTHGAVSVQWSKIKGGSMHKRVLAQLAEEESWSVKDWIEHFEGLPCREPWIFTDDIHLVQYMKKGTGVAGAAALIKVDRELARARWEQLLSGQENPDFDAMIDALGKLQKRTSNAAIAD